MNLQSFLSSIADKKELVAVKLNNYTYADLILKFKTEFEDEIARISKKYPEAVITTSRERGVHRLILKKVPFQDKTKLVKVLSNYYTLLSASEAIYNSTILGKQKTGPRDIASKFNGSIPNLHKLYDPSDDFI